MLDRLVVSTDDEQVAEISRRIGLEVPFLRPVELARDDTPMIDVAVHSLTALAEDGYEPEALLLLQPTSPLRTAEHIETALELLGDNDSVCSVLPVPKDECPHFLMKITPEGFLDYFMADGSLYTRRQEVPQAYHRDGTIYLTRTSVILKERSFYGRRCQPMLLRPEESLNIDEPADWQEAERRIAAVIPAVV
jgi:CMP-N-acetylneuraminic acid synthetase